MVKELGLIITADGRILEIVHIALFENSLINKIKLINLGIRFGRRRSLKGVCFIFWIK